MALTVLLAVYFYPGQSGTLYEASRLLHGEADASFGSHRVEIWREVCALIAQRPVFGGGPGTAAARLHIEFTRFVPETGRTLGTYVTNAHNEYLGYAMNLGWPGLALYLAIMGVTFFHPRKNGESAAWLWGRRGVLDPGVFRARPCRERAASVARVGAGAGAGGKERRT